MTFMVNFKVDANPVGKQRARYVKRGNFVQPYTPEKTRTYETLIKDAAIEAMGASEPLETPVSLYLYIRVPIPKSGFFVGFSDPLSMASNRFLVHDLGIGTRM